MADNPHATATVKVLDGGKVTIPEAVREKYGIEKGQIIEIDVRVI